MNQGYDSNGQVLKYPLIEIEKAKERVALKRSIRRKSLKLIPVNHLTMNQLIELNLFLVKL
jgi:hypothetical protein